MNRSLPLRSDGVLTLGAGGAGTYIFGPVPQWHTYDVDRVSVQCPDATAPALKINRNSAGGAFIDGTNDTSTNVSGIGTTLMRGESLVLTFTGGTANGRVVISIEGTDSETW